MGVTTGAGGKRRRSQAKSNSFFFGFAYGGGAWRRRTTIALAVPEGFSIIPGFLGVYFVISKLYNVCLIYFELLLFCNMYLWLCEYNIVKRCVCLYLFLCMFLNVKKLKRQKTRKEKKTFCFHANGQVYQI